MICNNCGKELPLNASFCAFCGKPQPGNNINQEIRWETCEVTIKHMRTEKVLGLFPTSSYCSFVANAIGPSGQYEAAMSSEFYYATGSTGRFVPYQESENACNELIKTLSQDGWEATGRREYWYQHTFRRRAK